MKTDLTLISINFLTSDCSYITRIKTGEEKTVAEHFSDMFHQNGYITATMQRRFEGVSAQQVWDKLSSEAERVKWLAPGTIDLYQGGRS